MNESNTIGVLILTLFIIIVLFLIFREVICWYWKINKTVSLMEEQNELLRKILAVNTNPTKKVINSSSNEEFSDSTLIVDNSNKSNIYIAPDIKTKNTLTRSSFLTGEYEEFQLEYTDGASGSIFYNRNKQEYYFKNKSDHRTISYYYDNFSNCSNALHSLLTNGEVLKVGYIGAFN